MPQSSRQACLRVAEKAVAHLRSTLRALMSHFWVAFVPATCALPACPTDCTRLHLLHAVWASVAQTRGRRQGLYFDPWTGAPRLDTAALHYALQLVANLTAAAAPQTRAGLPGAAAACGVGTAAAAADDGCMCTSAADINADSTPLSTCSCAVTLKAGTDHMQVGGPQTGCVAWRLR